jgi:N-acetylneuraminic acid mutarotase
MNMKTKLNAYIIHASAAALLFLCMMAHASAASASGQNRSLSFADRVAYQRAIEDVYWRHRTWPNTNARPKPALDAVMSQAQIEKKVTDYLRNSQALEDDWQQPIIPDQLQAEMERMASHTKQPEVLREIFAALGNDPFVIAECLARPVLAERLGTRLRADDEKPTAIAWLNQPLRSWLGKAETQMPMIMAAVSSANYKLPVIAEPSSSCTDDTWTSTTLIGAPSPRSVPSVWTGSEMIVWGNGSPVTNTGGRYNPSTDSWTATSTVDAPSARSGHTLVWTGSEMIVWGGGNDAVDFNTGGRYDPSTDSWTATSTNNAPLGRVMHTAVWTGSEMIVWGGLVTGGSIENTGGRYNPTTDSWTATSITNAPSARERHTAVWTGSEMIVWGGFYSGNPFNTGGRYNPITDSWTATTTAGAPEGRQFHTAVWTGSEMIVWGGNSSLNTGGRYNPTTNSWTATSVTNAPSARFLQAAVWTGREMIIWGGTDGTVPAEGGGRYDPGTDSWRATSTTDEPDGRRGPTAVWTGSEMIVWGGSAFDIPVNTGGRYCAQSGPPIGLDARVHRQGGKRFVVLTWSPADGGSINILRDSVVIGTTDDDGTARDNLGTHTGTFIYQVCETDSGDCSNEVRVRVRQTVD